MAKRKRLSPTPHPAPAQAADTSPLPGPVAWSGGRRPPIADVAGDAASHAALNQLSTELKNAHDEGRMVLSLALDRIAPEHLVRDRMAMDSDDMEVLKSSLRSRGQQTPVEVVDLEDGKYGLISGWRRLSALQALLEETGDTARFGTVKALVRKPDNAADAYRAMVEENEIRSDLSFYERAHIVVKAVEQGVYADTKLAVQGLFGAARPAKRSKILSFVAVVDALGAMLRFPEAIPEKLGLAMAQRLGADRTFPARLQDRLNDAAPRDASEERRVLEAALQPSGDPVAQGRHDAEEVRPGLFLQGRHGRKAGRIVLSGAQVTPALEAELRSWLSSRARRTE